MSAFVVDKAVRRKQLIKELQRAVKSQVKATLGSGGAGLPNWVVNRVVDFATSMSAKYLGDDGQNDDSASPIIMKVDPVTGRPIRQSSLTGRSPKNGDLPMDLTTQATTTDTFQTLFNSLEDDLNKYWNAAGSPTILGRRRVEKTSESSVGEDNDITPSQSQLLQDSVQASSPDKDTAPSSDKQIKMQRALDATERVLCSLFYDRLFAPEGSDDRSHDEALSSRVAALNMLDLTLEHLGVEIEEGAMTGVEKVVQAVGRGSWTLNPAALLIFTTSIELQRLEDPLCRSPGEKVSVLVAAHNVVVSESVRV